jgi:hypothetical protein
MIVLAAAALGETPTAWGRRHKLLVRGQPTISCTPGKTMQDGKECGSQIQQSLLLKKIAVIEPHNLRSKATCSTKYHKPFPEEHPFIILEKYIFSRVMTYGNYANQKQKMTVLDEAYALLVLENSWDVWTQS